MALFEVLSWRRSRREEGGKSAGATTITTTKQDETELAVCFPDNHNIYCNSVWCFNF